MATQYELHGRNYGTLAAAKKAAQNYADSHGEQVTVTKTVWAGSLRQGTRTVRREMVTVKPKTKRNPAARSNPSDSTLTGARILGTVRNSRGQVTGLRVQLRPDAWAAYNTTTRTWHVLTRGAAGGATRSNPVGAGGDKLPGVAKWHMHAGGTSAAAGKHGYTFNTGAGTYSVSPISFPNGRHRGYLVSVWGAPGHYGHHQIGRVHASPAKAVAAAQAFQSKL